MTLVSSGVPERERERVVAYSYSEFLALISEFNAYVLTDSPGHRWLHSINGAGEP